MASKNPRHTQAFIKKPKSSSETPGGAMNFCTASTVLAVLEIWKTSKISLAQSSLAQPELSPFSVILLNTCWDFGGKKQH